MKGRGRLASFFATLKLSSHASLLLDYDGTLAPFQVERHTAYPYPGVRLVLEAIRKQTLTRLVIISGRALEDLLPLLDLHPAPEVWGCHGWERQDVTGLRRLYPLTTDQQRKLAEAWTVIEDCRLDGHCERKPASIALHWRGLPEVAAGRIAAQVRQEWERLTVDRQMEIHPFDGGLELRASGRSKATAVNEILADLGSHHVAAFLGDDLTDEDGFRAIRGRGLGVLVRPDLRPTAAEVCLEPPHELLDFLAEWLRLAPRAEGSNQ